MYKYELHVHTKEGSACSTTSIHDMIRKYKEQGYTGMAITNHFYGGNTCVSRELDWHDFVMEYARAYYEGLETAK
ncbi:MAG: PHP domain-containing protein, partial [Ruminiclostridium sp.]|nr:PHP domain-containing protein [Ruminiclostridium sp.]